MMRPQNAPIYDNVDLKLGIKSSLPSVKPTIALLFLMWREMGKPSELEYSITDGNSIILRPDIVNALYERLCSLTDNVSIEQFKETINNNLLMKSQLEALLVAFELVWRLAKIRFTDGRPNGAERTGGARFPKKVWYTTNIDLMDLVCGSDISFDKVLFSWLGFETPNNTDAEKRLVCFLTTISENALFKLIDNENEVIFNLESVYSALLGGEESVDINGDNEAKGPLRILKSALSEDLFANLSNRNGVVSAIDTEQLESYSQRVSTFHQLNPKVYVDAKDTQEPVIDYDALRNSLMSMDNQQFIIACLDLMKQHYLFSEKSLSILSSKSECAALFRHNAMNGILLLVNPAIEGDEQRKDANGNPRYYAEKHCIDAKDYYVSSEWRADREDARAPLIEWIFGMLRGIKFKTGLHSSFSRNRILFGAPGTGKSFTLNAEKNKLLDGGVEYERVTFHPDYSYANFVGTYKPVPCKDSDGKETITYSYVPGPFMRTYVKALENSKTNNPTPFLLIIEEINRANVAAVFGDVFQLLDRDENEISEYPIQASEDIKNYLSNTLGGKPTDYDEIRIPDNMFIWATMNSADQGVFPMDTAFKRRWDFTYLGIDDSEDGIKDYSFTFGKGAYQRTIRWNELRKAINSELLTYKVNEDKLMGPYFVSKKVLENQDNETFIRVFKNKVLMYLFDDAAKQKRPSLFAGCEECSRSLYSHICEEFDEKGIYIFHEHITNHFIQVEQGDV